MRIVGVLWSPAVVDKLAWKHNVGPEEVEQVFLGRPKYRKHRRGRYQEKTSLPPAHRQMLVGTSSSSSSSRPIGTPSY